MKPSIRRRSSSAPSLAEDLINGSWARKPFRFSPPQYNIRGLAAVDVSEKQSLDFTPKSNIISPPSAERLIAVSTSYLVPCLSLLEEDLDLQYQRTPVRTLFGESNEDDGASIGKTPVSKPSDTLSTPAKHRDTPMPLMSSSRLQRSVSRVKSYKEPSLTVKVRKGFKFFSFEDSTENSTSTH